ncbi:MAG: enoyl-CoA hydratase/isomerase family protein, partial [Deltaproteobacteria bacterium]|nr:enoyl-CoA hydratase/isomerase family protein [Deltaproteobacteria bacterium]
MERKYANYVIEDNIATVTLNNPPVNALGIEVVRELDQVFEEIKVNDSIRVVILTGVGKAFVAGANMKAFLTFDRKAGEQYALEVTDMQRKIDEFDVPVIAAVNGYALGGGCELAMSCDI